MNRYIGFLLLNGVKEPISIDAESSEIVGISIVFKNRYSTGKYSETGYNKSAIYPADKLVISEVISLPEPDPGKVELMEVAVDIVSRIFHYGNVVIETPSERTLCGILNELGLFPTTEEQIIDRPHNEKYYDKYRDYEIK